MNKKVYRYRFDPNLDITEVEATVTLSLLALESLHGESRVRLETRHVFDALMRSCVIDAAGEIGCDLNRLFFGFINREFGSDNFDVERVAEFDGSPASTAA